MASLEYRLSKMERFLKQRRKQGSRLPKHNVFILPDDQKRYEAFLRYAKKHPRDPDWVAIILPAKQEIG